MQNNPEIHNAEAQPLHLPTPEEYNAIILELQTLKAKVVAQELKESKAITTADELKDIRQDLAALRAYIDNVSSNVGR